jgi:hypothetical protein
MSQKRITRFNPNRSEQAFVWTCEAFERYARDNKQTLYFWTLTFVKKMPDSWYSIRWQQFIRDLGHLYRDGRPLFGVKVTEPHRRAGKDGPWRGLHYHIVFNHRVAVGEVRRIGRRYGIGHIDAKVVEEFTGLASYLGKYLKKSFESESVMVKGIRRWGTVGGFDGVRVNALRYNTPTTTACRRFREVLGRKLSFHEIRAVCNSKNVFDPSHLEFCLWYAAQPGNKTDPLYALVWPWWELEREMGLPANPMDGRVPF